MENREKKIVIDGITFQVVPFMSVEGLRLKAYLLNTFGPAIGELLGGIDGRKVKGFADIELAGISFSSSLEKLFEKLNEDSFIALIKRLLANVIATYQENGKSQTIDFGADHFELAMENVFSGRLFSIYELILFVLKVNYPDFFGKVVKGIGQRIQKTLTSEKGITTQQNESNQSGTSEG